MLLLEPLLRPTLAQRRVKADLIEPGEALIEPPADYNGTIDDQDVVVTETLRIAEYNGLLDNIVGSDGTLASWDVSAPATRAQTAQLLWNLYLKMHP